jgi:c-di-GMP-binding flagellar brake protein YcgR
MRERRNDPRVNVSLGVKVYDRRAQRYRPARTFDLSSGGALIEIHQGQTLAIGDSIDLAVEYSSSAAVVHHDDLLKAIVLRNVGYDHGHRRVAVRFVDRPKVALAA